MKICSAVLELLHADRQTDTAMGIFIGNFVANALKQNLHSGIELAFVFVK
jgi:hypothetical protein